MLGMVKLTLQLLWIWLLSGWLCFGAGFQPLCSWFLILLFPSFLTSILLGSRPPSPPHCFSMMLCFHDELLFPSLLLPLSVQLRLGNCGHDIAIYNFLLENHTIETYPLPSTTPLHTHSGWGRERDGRMTNCSAVSLCFVLGFVPSRFVCSLWASGRTHLPGHCALYLPLKLLIKHSQKVSCLADTHTEAKTDE